MSMSSVAKIRKNKRLRHLAHFESDFMNSTFLVVCKCGGFVDTVIQDGKLTYRCTNCNGRENVDVRYHTSEEDVEKWRRGEK